MRDKAHGSEHFVSEVAHLHNLRGGVRKHIGQVLPQATDTVVSAVSAALNWGEKRNELGLGIGECEEIIEVAPIERLPHFPRGLHVLLRHRPPSIPQAQESA
jgi:hypothetical protein